MGMRDFGALGAAFTGARALQVVSLITIIGMTANFISEMVNADTVPPKVIVGTLSVTCIAVLYCAITWILFLDNVLPFLLNTAMDSLVLIAVIVVAVTVGKPLSYLNCNAIGSGSGNAYDFTASMGHNAYKTSRGTVDYYLWVGADKASCLEMKSIWGLSIALCILFAFSAICSVPLWRRGKALKEMAAQQQLAAQTKIVGYV